MFLLQPPPPRKQMQTVRTLSDIIQKEVALNKCSSFALRRGILFNSQNFVLDIDTEIKSLSREKPAINQSSLRDI
jgi:hypothetical protein